MDPKIADIKNNITPAKIVVALFILWHQLHRSSGQSPLRLDGHSYDVEQRLTLHKYLPEAKTDQENTTVRRQIEATDAAIDKLVYDLYGLTEEEIGIVESGSGK